MANDLIIPLPKLAQEITITKDWIEKRDQLISLANQIYVTNDMTYKAASELLNEITKTSNALEKMRKTLSDPFAEAQKFIKRKSDDAREPLEMKKTEIQVKLANFIVEQRKAAEKARREAEEKTRAEIEKQLAEKKELEEAGLTAPETPFVPDLSNVPVPAIVEPPKSFATKTQDEILWELNDPDKIPEAFKSFDERKVNSWLRENKARLLTALKDNPDLGGSYISGILFRRTVKIIGRGN